MTAGDLKLCRVEATIRFNTHAKLPFWSGNSLRSGFGARLRDTACINRDHQEDCATCYHQSQCIYDSIYNARILPGKQNLRRTADPPRPFAMMPPNSGNYSAGAQAAFGFTLFGQAQEHLPYFLLALKALGESGLGSGYRTGLGRFDLESVDCIGYGTRSAVLSGDTVFSGEQLCTVSYQDILSASEEHFGDVTLIFKTPAQIKENGLYTAAPSFRGLLSRILSRANSLAELYGSGVLCSSEEALHILGQSRLATISNAATRSILAERYFHKQKGKTKPIAPFFIGELTYSGEFSREIMALLELGRHIHVGKMATFGNGVYEIRV
jgi:hypothetical protein